MTEESIFAAALAMAPDERPAFLDEACGGDADLRDRVQQLLTASDDASDSFLAKPAEELGQTIQMSEQERQSAQSRSRSLHEHKPPSTIIETQGGAKVMYFGEYELQGEIARGAMGVVYRAEQVTLKRTVAIKMIRSTLLANDGDVQRFKAEAEAAASLDHPNIVPIYEVGEFEGQHYFTMKLVEGGTLRDRMTEFVKDPRSAAEFMSKVAQAVHAAHQRGILHRDIKPGNILVDHENEPHVTDFGLAKDLDSASGLTLSGQIVGTPSYMAPEQAEASARLTTGADVYGLGAVFYEMLTGEPPFKGETTLETLRLVTESEVRSPRSVNPVVNRDLATIAMKCLSKEPKDRYASAQGLVNDVDRWLAGEPIKARPVGTGEKVFKWMKRKPAPAAAVALATLLLVVLGIGGPIWALQQAKLRQDAVDAQALEAEARERADSSTKLAEERAEEINRTLYANEMHLAEAALSQPGGVVRLQNLLDNWRPEEGAADFRGWEWNYLRSQLEPSEQHFEHPGRVRSAVWSADSAHVFTGCEDGKIRVWNVETGRVAAVFGDHTEFVEALAISPGGNRLASLDAGGALKIRDSESGEIAFEAKLEGGSGFGELAWSPDGSRLAAEDGNRAVVVLDSTSGEILQRFEADKSVRSVDWEPGGDRLAIGYGFTLLIHNFATSESQRFENSFRSSVVQDAEWVSDGDLIISAGGHLHLVDPDTEAVGEFPLESINRAEEADFCATNGLVAFAAQNRGVYVFHTGIGVVLANFNGHTQELVSVEWSADGQQLLTAAGDGVRIWRFPKVDRELISEGESPSMSWRPGGDEIAVSNYRGVRILSPSNPGSEVQRISLGDDIRYEAAWSSDGKRIAVRSNRRLSVWELGVDSPLWEVELEPEAGVFTDEISWEPGGERLMTSGKGRNLRLYSATDGALISKFPDSGWMSVFEWAPTGGRLAVSVYARLVIVDPDDGSVLEEWPLTNKATAMAWTPSGDILATAREGDRLVELWQVLGGKKLAEFDGDSVGNRVLAWSPDGALLAVGGLSGVVQIWNLELGRTVLTFQENGPVEHLGWDDSGTRLAISTKGSDARLRVRDAGPGLLAEASPMALPWLDQRTAAEPDRLRHRIARAELLERLDRWSPAAAEWARLAELRPDDADFARRGLEATLNSLKLAEAIAHLEAQLESSAGDSHAAGILAKLLIEDAIGDGWISLEIESAISEGGANLTRQPDGSFFAHGVNPPADVYRISARSELPRINAIRLETIPDERLPEGGSGRAANGNFQLGDFSVRYAGMPATIASAWADFHYTHPTYSGFPIEKAFDADPDSGWDTSPKPLEPHTAVFDFTKPHNLKAGAELSIRLQSATRGGEYPEHNLGRFRLSVASHPNAARLAELQQLLEGNWGESNGWRLLGEIRSIRNEQEAAAEAFARAEADLEVSVTSADTLEKPG
ncbi:MAG: WD40 repeat protein/tRNA A-37 threonylcarbamoyl transferase component Bud32 [Verrucomicrobiales bacterium]|jgi:WD40 repeat protein/tRNA A-37 threonylcarbamoyl transferase component Bud32